MYLSRGRSHMLTKPFILCSAEHRGNDSGGSPHLHHTGFEALGDTQATSSFAWREPAGSAARASIGRSSALLAPPTAAAQYTLRARPAFMRFRMPCYALSTVRRLAYRRPIPHVATDSHARAFDRRDCVALSTAAVACLALSIFGLNCESPARLRATVRCPRHAPRV